ncbi:uncharacterized protein LOC143348148 [Colletes latitarsis]|uniref:uncharacterized protein LOC143348148 n=1 Tax=Colletes latitarsis TaxID=2605962 RepID=UPI0040356083
MLVSSSKHDDKESAKNENPQIPPNDSNNVSLEAMRERIAVRYFLKKSKRFDYRKFHKQYQMPQMKIPACKEPVLMPVPEFLVYLGLASNCAETRDRDERKTQEDRNDFQFPKPTIYECVYCAKIFFHKLLHRRHNIRHMRKMNCCVKCGRGFTSKISRKRHQLHCRH